MPNSDPAGVRTQDPILKRDVLYLLSYRIFFPSTLRLTRRKGTTFLANCNALELQFAEKFELINKRIRFKTKRHTCKNKRSPLRINALRLVKQGIICIFVAENQQNSKQSPMPNANIVEIYYMLDEFSKLFDAALQAHGLKLGRGGARRRASLMSEAEVMTILVLFHTFGCRALKAFYLGWTCMRGSAAFPRVLSYSRFVERL